MSTVTLDDFPALLVRENVTRKKTFGMPSLFVNGNMFLSITGEGVAMKLSAADGERALKLPAAKPMPLKGWVELSFESGEDGQAWAERACDFAASLPPKAPKLTKKAKS